jgi:hypothetical protein
MATPVMSIWTTVWLSAEIAPSAALPPTSPFRPMMPVSIHWPLESRTTIVTAPLKGKTTRYMASPASCRIEPRGKAKCFKWRCNEAASSAARPLKKWLNWLAFSNPTSPLACDSTVKQCAARSLAVGCLAINLVYEKKFPRVSASSAEGIIAWAVMFDTVHYGVVRLRACSRGAGGHTRPWHSQLAGAFLCRCVRLRPESTRLTSIC